VDELHLLRIRFALQDLNAEYTYLLDHNRVDALAELFTEDAVYTHGNRRSDGRGAIRALFAARSSSGSRTARHLSTGLKVHIDSESVARGSSVCLTFAFDGLPPITPAIPYLVADFEDTYRFCADGRWRFSARNIQRIFVAEGNPGPVGRGK
jgi:hypothetical protein